MTIREQIDAFDELIQFIENELPLFAQQVASNDLVALITNRVVQRGENYKGQQFSPYSKKTVAAFRFWGKSRNQSAERKVRALARARGALSYEEFRELNNLNVDKKNFEFTGEMWRKFGVIRTRINGDRFQISIGGTTTASQEKIDKNSAEEGISIIENNAQEEKLVEKAVLAWIEQQAERILNQ